MIKKLSLALVVTALSVSAAFAGVAPGCIGGCMGQAPDAGSITLPAGYQCVTGWPNWAPVSCAQADIKTGADMPASAPPSKHHKG